jgi:hypothetical protein
MNLELADLRPKFDTLVHEKNRRPGQSINDDLVKEMNVVEIKTV